MPPDLKIFARMSHGAHGAQSSHDNHNAAGAAVDNTQPVAAPVPIRVTAALNPIRWSGRSSSIRARDQHSTREEAVIIAAHGPVPDQENSMAGRHARAGRADGCRDLVRRDQVPDGQGRPPKPVRDAATAELRRMVEEQTGQGRRVLIVPLLLSSADRRVSASGWRDSTMSWPRGRSCRTIASPNGSQRWSSSSERLTSRTTSRRECTVCAPCGVHVFHGHGRAWARPRSNAGAAACGPEPPASSPGPVIE